MSASSSLSKSLLPTSAAARRAGVSANYIRRLADDGRLPVTETPLGRLFDARAIDAFAAARRPNGQAA